MEFFFSSIVCESCILISQIHFSLRANSLHPQSQQFSFNILDIGIGRKYILEAVLFHHQAMQTE